MQIVLFDHISTLFCDHNYGSIGISADNIGHNAGINDPQSSDPMNLQSRINDCLRIASRAHFGCAHRMVNRLRIMLRHTTKEIVTQIYKTTAPGNDDGIKGCIDCLENTRAGDSQAEFSAFNLSRYT